MAQRGISIVFAVLALAVGLSSSVFAGEIENRVIYGEDNRLDIYQVTDKKLLEIADSTVALIPGTDVTIANGMATLAGEKFADAYGLCEQERFREQNTSAFCSGSLVAPNMIITAGHCIEDDMDCSNARFVFGYAVKKKDVLPTAVPATEVYSCKKLVHSERLGTGPDFAVIELDRNVTGHKPLAMSKKDVVKGDKLVVIGHPSGLPTKVSGGAAVRKLGNGFFVSNLDTYGGNSGSAVFNATTYEIEGILVRGENDFVTQNGCTISNVCADDACRGEDSTLISKVIPYIK